MSQSTKHMDTFFNESNNIVGSEKFLEWKKMIDLIFVENKVMEYFLGEIFQPYKEKTQELEKYKNGEVITQRFIIETIKDHLVPLVVDLKTSKAMHAKC